MALGLSGYRVDWVVGQSGIVGQSGLSDCPGVNLTKTDDRAGCFVKK